MRWLFLLLSTCASAREVEITWNPLPQGQSLLLYVQEKDRQRFLVETTDASVVIDLPDTPVMLLAYSKLGGIRSDQAADLVIAVTYTVTLQWSNNLKDWKDIRSDVVEFSGEKGFWRNIIETK